VEVRDTQAPDIDCPDSFDLVVNSSFNLKDNIKVSDKGGLKPEVSIKGDLDMKTAKSYELKVIATDKSQNQAEKTVIVNVIDPELTEGDYSFTTAKGFKGERKDGITYVEGLLIANKSFSLPKTYAPGGIINEAFQKLLEMQRDASSEGLDIFTISGFRSYDTQVRLYNSYAERDGKDEADRYSSRPGYSDHQTGYAVDVVSVETTFENTAEGKWINDHAYEYGYVIRYPKGKEKFTGYMFEPWHLRYVGKELAETLYNGGDWISIEEYYGIPSVYTGQ
jgi:D-alanyl-D-alanine carboxypeptidase